MIGDGWDGEPSVRPAPIEEVAPGVRRVAVVTGSRAEFGLLTPVMRAIERRPDLELAVIAAGSHLVPPATTYREVKAAFGARVVDAVPMQVAGRTGRDADVEALGAGVARFGRAFARVKPDWVVVLGDRIEAFAAASAGSVGGFAVAHIHGGDRAEGVADEAMRHAITKLAHLHLAATDQSAARIVRMGERPELVRMVGSPAIDALSGIEPLADSDDAALGSPSILFLLHPVGRPAEHEETVATAALEAALRDPDARVLAMHPNLDAGREGILRAIAAAGAKHASRVKVMEHMARDRFVGLLKRMSRRAGVIVGNSSAALIEAAALRVPSVDIGPRQAGRERGANVVTAASETADQIAGAIAAARRLDLSGADHPYGDGRAGERIAAALADLNPHDPRLLRKRCVY
jgi:UDP-hydrolysing UDP-N-acetyl-D-glucosamine 2-epimerase